MCEALKVRSTTDKGDGVIVLIAAMTVAYKIIRETFTTRATLDKPNLTVLVEYLDGPFKRMQNRWTFHPTAGEACEVDFFIDYEFKSRTLAMLMGALFDTVFRKYAAAFEKRPQDEIYGRAGASFAMRLLVPGLHDGLRGDLAVLEVDHRDAEHLRRRRDRRRPG